MNNRTDLSAAVLVIGNEILSGRTADMNINAIATRMTDIGVALREVRVVADVEADITAAVNALRSRYTYLFTTGGIGPTHDDITIASIAKAFDVPVERNEQVVAMIKNRPNAAMNTEATFRMADYPQGAQLIPAGEGIPPACSIGNVYVLAGVPRVMQMMLESAIPLLEQGARYYSKTVDAFLPESQISAPLEETQDMYPEVEIGSYPFRAGDTFGTSLVVRGQNEKLVETAFVQVEKFVKELSR